jgi:hypothetical protein
MLNKEDEAGYGQAENIVYHRRWPSLLRLPVRQPAGGLLSS